MSYEEIVRHAHTYGLVLLTVVFALSVIYALWPGNKERFKQAARTPLNDEADDV